jgi:hypothetical protein
LIYGVSGAGTMPLEKFQRDHSRTCEERSGRRTVVTAELPPVPFAAKSLCRNRSLTKRRRVTHHVTS